MEILKTPADLPRLLSENPVLILQFHSESCGPCQSIRQKLDSWTETHEHTQLLSVSVENFPEIAAAYGIFTVPAVLVFVEGKLTLRETGCFSLNEIFHKTERYLSIIS